MQGFDLREAVAASADPSRVAVVLDRLGDSLADLGRESIRALIAVAGASDSLGELACTDPDALDVLSALDHPVGLDASTPAQLARTHRLALLRIAARDLTGVDDLAAVLDARSALADAALAGALELAEAPTLGVIAMGKLGAHELNYVSDVDVVLVGAGDPAADDVAARRFLDVAGRCVRVDVNLRPGGRDGALVRSPASYAAHWERWASAWEFQALLKARPVAGPRDALAAWAAAAEDALWGREFGADDLREIRHLKARAEAELAASGRTDRDLKRSPGGIRDIEFSVQLLQLVHGGVDTSLRVRDTIGALDELAEGGYVDGDEAATLARAYGFLRRVEHRLQLVQERQTHDLPEDRSRRRRIARAVGYRGRAEGGATDRFDRDLAEHRLAVRRIHEGWYFRPLLDAFAGGAELPADASAARLGAFGFRDAERTAQAVRALSGGLTRSSRLMRQLLPLLLDWLSQGPDPDLGLLGLRRLVESTSARNALTVAFRDSASTARRLCDLLTVSPLAADLVASNPDLVARLDDAARLGVGDRSGLLDSAWQSVGWREAGDAQAGALRRWHRRHLVGVVARDVFDVADVTEVGADLTVLAEAVVETALTLLAPEVPVAVIGMGRAGGAELSYGSDLDLVVVFDGAGADETAEAERVASGLLRLVRGTTPATRILDVDADLRPEGRQGPLARSLESYLIYLERWAQPWERQALLRARPIAGDGRVGRSFISLVDHALWTRPPTEEDAREIRRIKARGESERIPRGLDPRRNLKLGPGGLADVEWTVQLLQWQHGIRRRSTLAALGALVAAGVVAEADADALAAAHRHADEVRNRAWLVLGDGNWLPEDRDRLAVLARSLGTSGPALLEAHRRTARRCRAVVESRFYGIGPAGA